MFYLKCADKFGDYGIVGFLSVSRYFGQPTIENFVISCRVAQKKVEETVLSEIADYYRSLGYNAIFVEMIETEKNSPLREVFRGLPFNETERIANRVKLRLDLGDGFSGPAIMKTSFMT